LELREDGKVYENGVLFIDPSANFPVYNVSYTGRWGTYAPAEWGTPVDMAVAME
jgi:hypothetical protein